MDFVLTSTIHATETTQLAEFVKSFFGFFRPDRFCRNSAESRVQGIDRPETTDLPRRNRIRPFPFNLVGYD